MSLLLILNLIVVFLIQSSNVHLLAGKIEDMTRVTTF